MLCPVKEKPECSILVNDIRNYEDFYNKYNVEDVEKEELLERADIVTLHVPLDQSTQNMLSIKRLALMKKNAILINVARGGLVDEIALKNMLLNNRLAGAAFDVFLVEPPQDQELLSLPNLGHAKLFVMLPFHGPLAGRYVRNL